MSERAGGQKQTDRAEPSQLPARLHTHWSSPPSSSLPHQVGGCGQLRRFSIPRGRRKRRRGRLEDGKLPPGMPLGQTQQPGPPPDCPGLVLCTSSTPTPHIPWWPWILLLDILLLRKPSDWTWDHLHAIHVLCCWTMPHLHPVRKKAPVWYACFQTSITCVSFVLWYAMKKKT